MNILNERWAGLMRARIAALRGLSGTTFLGVTIFAVAAISVAVLALLGTTAPAATVARSAVPISMTRLVADAKAKGAKVLSGGARLANRGYYFPLTVLSELPDNARAMREEPFGPLALVNPVKNLDEAISKANSLPYGLAAYAFTNSARNVDRLSEEIEVGNLSINHYVASLAETPFGGVKDSGYGREGGVEGLQGYTVVKNVSHLAK